ncbi:MAG: DUF6913 domain-containing protein [Cytophagaceae bacterium]
MIKKLFQAIRILFSKKNTALRKSVPYSKANSIGFLINNNNEKDSKFIKEFVQSFINDGKKVTVVVNSLSTVSGFEFPMIRISKEDFSWNGKIKNEKIKEFAKTEFDYLLVISNSLFLPFDQILAISKAKLRIGGLTQVEEEKSLTPGLIEQKSFSIGKHKLNLLEVSIKTAEGETLSGLLSQMKQFINKLKD